MTSFYRLPSGKIKDGSLFGYFQCDLIVPDELRSKFANFPPIFENTEVGRDDIGDYLKNYAIENEMLKHPQRILISSFKLENGTVITALFNFYLELGLQRTKIFRFVQYTPQNVSIISFNKWLMLEEKEMKNLCQELQQKR